MRVCLAFAVAAAASSIGCAEWRDVYKPTAEVSAAAGGEPAARYPIPAGSPRGEAFVAALGVIRRAAPEGGHAVFLVVRLTADNADDDGPWTIDLGAQRLELPGTEPLYAEFTDGEQEGPVFVVEPDDKRTVDLYYRLPPWVDPARLTHFALAWSVATPGAPVEGRTAFERVRVSTGTSFGSTDVPPSISTAGAPVFHPIE